ncbi:MAG: FAD-dependent monooxygenase [Rubricella sp.]
MEFDTDIAIVGGGLNGPALALALAQGGIRSTILDAAPLAPMMEADFDGRAYAIALASRRLLEGIGVWPDVEGHAQPILDIKVSDGREGEGASPLHVHFDHREIEEGPFGALLEDRYLRAALIGAVAAEDLVEHRSEARVTAQAPDATGITLTLDDGSRLRSRLVGGCDGRRSGTAERAGIGRTIRDYGQTSLVCALDHERPHRGIAHQMFLPAGPLAILPLPGNRSSIVWTETTERAAEIMRLEDDAYMEVLRPRFGDFLGAIALVGGRYCYPLNLTLANRFTADRLALAGDAAHGLHPIAGQGLNLGLRDVAALAEVVVDARRRGEDIGTRGVLDRYARWRRFDTAALALATDGINRLFSNDNPILRGIRDLGLAAVNATPAARRAFMREAAGLTGDVPRLMRGLPL